MKPVNLLPAEAAVAKAATGGPNLGMIGGAVAGVVLVVAVAGYFGMARVDSIKSETEAARAQAAEMSSQAAEASAQAKSIGAPPTDSDKDLARGQEAVLVSAYTERHDFVLLAQELRGIMQGTGGWYVKVEAAAAASEDSKAVTITGVMPTKELAASFNERMNATRTLDNAEHSDLKSVTLRSVKDKRPGQYWQFIITADLVDTEAPYVNGGTGANTSDGSGTTVSDGGGELTLSLDPEHVPAKAKQPKQPKQAKEPAEPKNPFDVAASNAAKGGS